MFKDATLKQVTRFLISKIHFDIKKFDDEIKRKIRIIRNYYLEFHIPFEFS